VASDGMRGTSRRVGSGTFGQPDFDRLQTEGFPAIARRLAGCREQTTVTLGRRGRLGARSFVVLTREFDYRTATRSRCHQHGRLRDSLLRVIRDIPILPQCELTAPISIGALRSSGGSAAVQTTCVGAMA
jgi:hypothetical protein